MARFLGTGRFIVGQTVLVVGWIILNTIGAVKHWDPPTRSSCSNLAFLTEAAYAAPLILLAQNRQDDRDRASIDRDLAWAARTQAEHRVPRLYVSPPSVLRWPDGVTTQDLGYSLSRLVKVIADHNACGRARRPLVAGRGVRAPP